MVTLIILLPWVLTLGTLSFIILRSKQKNIVDDLQEDDDDGMTVNIRVARYGDKAYWVHDNTFYEADLISEPNFLSARPIDTISLSPKELNKLLNILDELENYGRQ